MQLSRNSASDRPSLGIVGNDFFVFFDGQSSLMQKIFQLPSRPFIVKYFQIAVAFLANRGQRIQ